MISESLILECFLKGFHQSILAKSAQGVRVLLVFLVGLWVSGLVGAGAFRRVELAEDVELVERGEGHEDEIRSISSRP